MFRLVNKCKNKKGFTLIELIVVLAVLGIIAAIAVPRYLGVQEKAQQDADEQTIEMVKSALELCIAAEDIALPTDSAQVATIDESNTAITDYDSKKLSNNISKYLDINNAKLNSGTVTLYVDNKGNITQK